MTYIHRCHLCESSPDGIREIPEGHIWVDDEGGIMTMHFWHRWFAWRPVFLANHGWVWLRSVERRFSERSTKLRRTFEAEYRLIGAGQNLADANSKKDRP